MLRITYTHLGQFRLDLERGEERTCSDNTCEYLNDRMVDAGDPHPPMFDRADKRLSQGLRIAVPWTPS